jgi:hypothetical protein
MSNANEQVFTGTSETDSDQEPVLEVPTSRTGRVVDISGQVSFCMDGAQYELVERGQERLRLKATNPDAERVLAAAAGTPQEVTVSGYIRFVECERMDVYDAQPAGGGGQPGENEPVETRQGVVEEIPEGTVSFCQDGAEYELVTQTADGEERLRLRAAPGRARSVLKRYAGTGQEVSVTGTVSHVECTVMDVVQAQPVDAGADAQADAAYSGEPAGETRQGLVEEIPAGTVSICMDGAEYELVSRTVEGETRLRLKPVSGRAGAVLKRYAGTGTEVSVSGSIVHVECTRMDVRHAEAALVAT